MPPKKKTFKHKITQKEKIAARLIEISLLVDGYIYNRDPISVEDAEKYAKEVARLEPKCRGDVRSLQVIEKLTRFMKNIIKEQFQSEQNYSLPTCDESASNCNNSTLANKTLPTPNNSYLDRIQTNLEIVQIHELPTFKVNECKKFICHYKIDKCNINDFIDVVDLDRTLSNISISLIDPQQKDLFNIFNSVNSPEPPNTITNKNNEYSPINTKEIVDNINTIEQNKEYSSLHNTTIELTQYKESSDNNLQNYSQREPTNIILSHNFRQNTSDTSAQRKISSDNKKCENNEHTRVSQSFTTVDALSLQTPCVKPSQYNIQCDNITIQNNKDQTFNNTTISQNLHQNISVEHEQYKLSSINKNSPGLQNTNCYLEQVQKNQNKCIAQDIVPEKISVLSYNETSKNLNLSRDVQKCNSNTHTPFKHKSKIRKPRKPKEKKQTTQNLKNNDPVKKRARKPKNNANVRVGDSKKSVCKVIDLSWIENIKFVRVIDPKEYDDNLAVDDAFWNNCSLPSDWSEDYFISET